jgi:hypothetical protein
MFCARAHCVRADPELAQQLKEEESYYRGDRHRAMQHFNLATDFVLFSDPGRNSSEGVADAEGGGVYVTQKPLLSPAECATIITHAEEVTQKRGGWSTSRHYSVPTTDVPLNQLPADVLKWFNEVLEVSNSPTLPPMHYVLMHYAPMHYALPHYALTHSLTMHSLTTGQAIPHAGSAVRSRCSACEQKWC